MQLASQGSSECRSSSEEMELNVLECFSRKTGVCLVGALRSLGILTNGFGGYMISTIILAYVPKVAETIFCNWSYFGPIQVFSLSS